MVSIHPLHCLCSIRVQYNIDYALKAVKMLQLQRGPFISTLSLSLYHYYIITMRFKQLFEHFTSPSLIIHNFLV